MTGAVVTVTAFVLALAALTSAVTHLVKNSIGLLHAIRQLAKALGFSREKRASKKPR